MLRLQRGLGIRVQQHGLHQQDGLVGQLWQCVQVVRGDQDRGTAAGEVTQQRADGGFAAFVDSSEWFIEQQEVGALGDASGQERSFALPAGELPDLAVLIVGEFDAL